VTRKSSKTGECAAFARLAAFSCHTEERAFQKFGQFMLHGRAAVGGEKSLIDTNGQDFWEIGTISCCFMFKKLIKSSLFR